MPRRLSFKQRLDRYPPALIRIVLVSPHWDPSDVELAAACGLTVAEFLFVSYSPRWDGPQMAYLWRYCRGCRVDLENRRCFGRLEWMRKRGCRLLGRSQHRAGLDERLRILEENE